MARDGALGEPTILIMAFVPAACFGWSHRCGLGVISRFFLDEKGGLRLSVRFIARSVAAWPIDYFYILVD